MIMSRHKPEGGVEDMGREDDPVMGKKAVAEEIIHAVSMKDAAKLVEAMEALFEMFDSAPHVEGPHIDGES